MAQFQSIDEARAYFAGDLFAANAGVTIDQLGEEEVVVLDEERKAQMVSNLLVVLCGNKDAQPIVNSGSIY